jgi:hypothetical protein
MPLTAANPAQCCFWIAADGVIYQRFDGLDRSGLAGFGPAPGRRTRLSVPLLDCNSAIPRLIVLRAIPVADETALAPPRPSDNASLAANKRRPRSSRKGLSLKKTAAYVAGVYHPPAALTLFADSFPASSIRLFRVTP